MSNVQPEEWGNCPAGPVYRYTLTNRQGNSVSILNYGGVVQSVRMGGEELVIGFDRIEGYLGKHPYYGAIIGRYANRIAGARFELDGNTYRLTPNENGNQLHGGPDALNRQRWTATTGRDEAYAKLRLTHRSPDGKNGYPGSIDLSCTYTWDDENALHIEYTATSDRDTYLNLTNHSYFNLGGAGTQVLDHVLELKADRYIPVDSEGIPLGHFAEVAGTPFDFRSAKTVGKDIDADHPQLREVGGYDHTFMVTDYDGTLRRVARIDHPPSGRSLTCLTDAPGVQLFTTNFAPGEYRMRGDAPVPPRGGICLETQYPPDAPNQPNFDAPLLKAGQRFNTTTVYRFEG
jgi:aldose 1-epimerase